jgi:hypothetical protein
MVAVALEADYDDHYSYQPSSSKIRFIAQELAIKEQLIQPTGWQLVKPQNITQQKRSRRRSLSLK